MSEKFPLIPCSKIKLGKNIEIYGFGIFDDKVELEVRIYKDSEIFEVVKSFLENLLGEYYK